MIRVFAAYPLQSEFCEIVEELSLKNKKLDHVRWTRYENLHITLFFIGEIEESDLNEVQNALEIVARAFRPFRIYYDSIILQGQKSIPSMVWARFKDNNEFSQLSESIHDSVKQYMTIKVSHKNPIPHCTLARIKRGNDELFPEIVTEKLPPDLPVIDRMELWQTVQTHSGVRYSRLGSYFFQGN